MSISVGDKYVIEIGAVAELPEGKKKYFIKPFESLVFDRKGLEQLEKFDAQATKEEWGKAEYDRGFEDGKNEVFRKTELIPELKKVEYTKGYNKALEDASNLMAFFDCNFMSECYPEEYKEDYSLYDLNAKYGLAEILEKWKAYKKQKQEIKNYNKVVNTLRTVTDEYPRETIISALSEFGIEVKE